MKIERPRLGVCIFVRRRGDRFFPGTLFQDRRAGKILFHNKIVFNYNDFTVNLIIISITHCDFN